MGTLRPFDTTTGKVKRVKDYTPEEKSKALLEMKDEARTRIAAGKPIDQKTAQTIIDLAKGTPEEDTIQPEILEAATAPASGKKDGGNKQGDDK